MFDVTGFSFRTGFNFTVRVGFVEFSLKNTLVLDAWQLVF